MKLIAISTILENDYVFLKYESNFLNNNNNFDRIVYYNKIYEDVFENMFVFMKALCIFSNEPLLFQYK